MTSFTRYFFLLFTNLVSLNFWCHPQTATLLLTLNSKSLMSMLKSTWPSTYLGHDTEADSGKSPSDSCHEQGCHKSAKTWWHFPPPLNYCNCSFKKPQARYMFLKCMHHSKSIFSADIWKIFRRFYKNLIWILETLILNFIENNHLTLFLK